MSPNKENAQTIDKEINMSKNNLTKKLSHHGDHLNIVFDEHACIFFQNALIIYIVTSISSLSSELWTTGNL